jgi:hypothetical protein
MDIAGLKVELKRGKDNIAFLTQYINELKELMYIATKYKVLSTHEINR